MNITFKSALVCGVIAATSLSASAAPNIVTNGDFEAGFAGWSTTSDFVLSSQQTHSGDVAAATGCASHSCVDTAGEGSYITQTVATTAGTRYDLSFWVGQDSPPPAEFSVFWDGVMVGNQDVSTPSGLMVQWTFSNLVATGSATVFEIHGRQDSGAIYFDDVSVAATGTGGSDPDGTPGGNTDVPEPGSVALMGLGLAGFAAARRRVAKGR